MENITKVRFGAMPENSGLIRPFRMYYVQNNVEKNWDLALVDDTVAIIVYNKTTDKLIFVKQFRPDVYYDSIKRLGCKRDDEINTEKYPPAELGKALELCTVVVEKGTSFKDAAQKEIEEVCGYRLSSDRIEDVMTYRSDVGASGAEETLFYCEVSNEDKVQGNSDAINDKGAEIVEMSIPEAMGMITRTVDVHSPQNCKMGVLWFLRNKSGR